MLNIFADALLIASRMGQMPSDAKRSGQREFRDIEGLRIGETLRNQGR